MPVGPQIDQVDRAWNQSIKQRIDESLTNFAFNFNLRPSTAVHAESDEVDWVGAPKTPARVTPSRVTPGKKSPDMVGPDR